MGGEDERARARRERSTRTGSEEGERGSLSEERDDWEIRRIKERRVSSWLRATSSSSSTQGKGYRRATVASSPG